MKAYASGGAGSRASSRPQERGRSVTQSTPTRTWSTRFAFNGTQISSDGRYQINPISTPSGTRYELISFNGRGGNTRVGVYNSLDSAKGQAK